MGAHVGLLPHRTPLWRLFPLPGTPIRRLSPQKHPSDPPGRPTGAEGFRWPAASNTASSISGLAGQETRQTWTGGGSQTRLNDHRERPVASKLAQARLVLVRSDRWAEAQLAAAHSHAQFPAQEDKQRSIV